MVTVSGTCTNAGPSDAAGPTCALVGLPAGVTQSCEPSPLPDPFTKGSSITCTSSSFAAPVNGALSVTTRAASTTADPAPSNNDDLKTVNVATQADMQATTTAPATASPGESVTVSARCTNAGPSTADAPTCGLSGLPAGATQSCFPNNPASLAVGDSIICTSTFPAPASGTLTFTSTAGSNTADPSPLNNTDQRSMRILVPGLTSVPMPAAWLIALMLALAAGVSLPRAVKARQRFR